MKFILAEKIAMTQLWQGEERKVATRLKVGSCVVLQLKTKDKDGYEAVQLGFGVKKAKNITKSLKGHFKNLGNFRYVREFRLDLADRKVIDLQVGDAIDLTSFVAGDQVKLTGVSKGKGFAGVVKRHGFHGHNATHGTKDQLRMPGSIGAGGVQRVFKGKRMAGRMGGDQVTLPSVNILVVDALAGEILIEGAVPGVPGSLVEIYGKGELKVLKSESPKSESHEEIKAEEVVSKSEETVASEEAAPVSSTEEAVAETATAPADSVVPETQEKSE